ncbi:MAG: hypothetical protein DCF15_03990 [Phormidesmis priestleyi]|uniref:Uncharacterized protein n=1 Tax=Phormidesmis priestleyi TaxID=268141 RepID=A0A2W4XPG0_9CYAN|nr:MAG: hypothetical protein DCF15_03990 [Phormidesmis priestleyi]
MPLVGLDDCFLQRLYLAFVFDQLGRFLLPAIELVFGLANRLGNFGNDTEKGVWEQFLGGVAEFLAVFINGEHRKSVGSK